MRTKSELVLKIKEDLGDNITKMTIESVIDAYCRVVARALAAGEDVKITDIGVLRPVDVAEKTGRNPQTGKALKIPAHKTIKFRISKALKEKLK